MSRPSSAGGPRSTPTRSDASAWPLRSEVCRPVYGCSFGDERFLALIREGGWDLLCHHAADVTNYKSPDFDAVAALRNNTHNLPAVLEALRAAGCRRLLLTGSVFEGGEGCRLPGPARLLSLRPVQGPDGTGVSLLLRPRRPGPRQVRHPQPLRSLRGASLHGLSHEELAGRRHAESAPALPTSATISTCRCWPRSTPSSLRSSRPPASPGSTPAATPRARARSRSAWPRRCDPRLGLPCPVELKKQVDFPEPRVRINTDPPDADALGWDESAAWDEMAHYYQRSVAT